MGYQAKYASKARLVRTQRLPLEEKKRIVLQWLTDQQAGVESARTVPTRAPGNEALPQGVYRWNTGRKRFLVNMRGHPQKSFATLEEAEALRAEYLK